MREEVKSARIENLKSFFDEWDINHFGPKETCQLSHPDWPFDRLFPPPERMHENLRKTIILADEIRSDLGAPIKCISGYRPNAYNELIKGSPSSQHLSFYALDLKPIYHSQFNEFVQVAEKKVEESRSFGNIVGRGLYDTFIHIDTQFYSHQRNWDQRS